MERLTYFLSKLWTFVSTIHPLIFLTILIVSGLLFFVSKRTIQKLRPQTSSQNLVVFAVTVFIGLPFLVLILLLIVDLILKDQPF